MGFFSWIAEKISDAAEWVVEKATNVIDFVEDKIEDVVDFFNGGRTSLGHTSTASAREISKAGAYDPETATIEETKAITKVLNDIKEEYKTKLKQYEEKSIELSKEIKNKIVDMIETELNQKSNYDPSINPFIQSEELEKEINKKFEGLGINVGEIETKFSDTITNFKRTFSSEILDHIAISDRRCSDILKLKNKREKEKEIKSYLDELVDNALNNFCFNIDEISKTSLYSIKENVNKIMKNNEESIKNIKKEIEENIKLSESEIEAKRKEYERKEKIINNLLETIKL
mgnify:CR=1 FL=1